MLPIAAGFTYSQNPFPPAVLACTLATMMQLVGSLGAFSSRK
jgi:hypothetical protein